MTTDERIQKRLATLLTPEDEARIAAVGAAVREVLEELATEHFVDPSTIDRETQGKMEEHRAQLLLHRVASDPTLCFVKALEAHEDGSQRVEVTFSIPRWVTDSLGLLSGSRRVFEPQVGSSEG